MAVLESRFRFLKSLQICWPESPEQVQEHLRDRPVVTVMQCDDNIAEALKEYTFWRRPFHTALVDLSCSEDQLWGKLDRLSRRQISLAERMGCRATSGVTTDDVLQLINRHIRRKNYRKPFKNHEWRRLLRDAEVFSGFYNGELLAAHVVLVDGLHRARLLITAVADHRTGPHKDFVGPVNRLLHWHEILTYKQRGVHWYDFGGVVLDRSSSVYSVTQFKLSLGGAVVRGNVLHLTASRPLRLLLRLAAYMKRKGV